MRISSFATILRHYYWVRVRATAWPYSDCFELVSDTFRTLPLFFPLKYLLVSRCAVFTYCFPTTTTVARTRLSVTFYAHCLSFLISKYRIQAFIKTDCTNPHLRMLTRRRLVIGMWRKENVIYACALCPFRRGGKLYASDICCGIYQWHLPLPRIVERWQEAHNTVRGYCLSDDIYLR